MLQFFRDVPHEQMIQDITDELNRMGEPDASPLSIVAFGTKTLTILPADRGNPLVVFGHGLGYAPIFQLFNGSISNQGVFPQPIIDALDDGAGGLLFGGTVNAFADAANIYVIWNDQLQTSQQTFTYIVYNGPIVGS